MPYCPTCDSENAQELGTLGERHHFRCNACGIDYSKTSADLDSEGLWESSNEESWEESWEESYEEEPDCDDSDDGEALASAGFGTDEDYGCFGGDDDR